MRVGISTEPWFDSALPYVLELLGEAGGACVTIFGDEGRGHLHLSRWIGHQAAIDGTVIAVRRSGLQVQALDIGFSCCSIPVGKGGDSAALARLQVAIEIAVRLDAPLICLSVTGLGAATSNPSTACVGAQSALLEQMCLSAARAGVRLGCATSSAATQSSPTASAWFAPPREAGASAGDCEHIQIRIDSGIDLAATAAWLADQIGRWPGLTASVSSTTSTPETPIELARSARLLAAQ